MAKRGGGGIAEIRARMQAAVAGEASEALPGAGAAFSAAFGEMSALLGRAGVAGEGGREGRTTVFRPLPEDKEGWLRAHLGQYLQNTRGEAVGMAPHHEEVWAWLWGLRPGEAARTLIAIWARGGAKST